MNPTPKSPRLTPFKKNHQRWTWLAGATAAVAANPGAHAATAQITLVNDTLDSNTGNNLSLVITSAGGQPFATVNYAHASRNGAQVLFAHLGAIPQSVSIFALRHFRTFRFIPLLVLVLGLACVAPLRAQITDLTSFNGTNGQAPSLGGLLLSGGTLYGVTHDGGAHADGEVFSLPLGGGTPTVLASFTGGTAGANPYGGLVLSGSTLYGTTEFSGANGAGEVFSVPVGGGSISVVASFNATNGETPIGSLMLSGSTLYGTTETGGANGEGEVFSLPVGGNTITVLASFNGTNGASPYGRLILSGDSSALYGTTSSGGANGAGAVFSLPVGGGTPTVLASFNSNGTNGTAPEGGLLLSGSTLYGTTTGGGNSGNGVVFSVPVGGGTPTVLAAFNSSGTNGSNPYGSLTLSGSTLYGTTVVGGANNDGEVFSVPVGGGTPTVVASFNGTNGTAPESDLLLSGSTLYGTTSAGGANSDGTVFSISVPEPGSAVLCGLGLGVAFARRRRR